MITAPLPLYMRHVFLPFVFILGFMQAGADILRAFSWQFMKTYFIKEAVIRGEAGIIPLFNTATDTLKLFLIILFIILAYRLSVHRFFSLLIGSLAVLALLCLALFPFIEFLKADRFASVIQQLFAHQEGWGYALPEMVRYWPVTLFLPIFSVCSYLFVPILAWGVLNQITAKSEAFRYYIPMAIISSFIAKIFFPLPNLFNESLMVGLSILYFLVAFFLFKYFLSAFKPDQVDKGQVVNLKDYRGMIFWLGFLFISFGMAEILFRRAFEVQLFVLFNSGGYLSFIGLGVGIVAILCWVVGNPMLQKRGWSLTGRLGIIITLITGIFAVVSILFVSLYPMANPLPLFPVGMLYQSLLRGLHFFLIFPLVQIIYLTFSKEVRFKAKVWAEVIVASLLGMIPPFVELGLVSLLTDSQSLICMEVVSILILILAWLAIRKIEQRKEVI